MSILYFHFDGTDNSPSDAPQSALSSVSISNVLKSHLLLGGHSALGTTHSRLPNNSHSFYYSGIGTYGNWLEQKLNAAFAIESGDVAMILNKALRDFDAHFSSNIQHVVLIGFSRGAALARRFAALINTKLDTPIVIEAIMDTVASIGFPNIDKAKRPNNEVVFEYGCTLPSCVHKALHLVSLDEQRLAFRPTLINHDNRALEVWLSGVHSDIGGSYVHDGLGDIALTTLTHWLEFTLGKQVYASRNTRSTPYYQLVKLTPKPFGRLHYQTRRFTAWRDLTLSPRHSCVLENNAPATSISPKWHHTVSQRIRSNIGYFPIATCSTVPTLWHRTPHSMKNPNN